MEPTDGESNPPALAERKDELVRRACEVLDRRAEIVAAYLFGSLAHDGAGPLSDVDLAVLCDPAHRPAQAGWQTYWGDLHAELVHALALRDDQLDLVVLNDVTSSLLAHRATWGGTLIHCRDHSARVAFETRVALRHLDAARLRHLRWEVLRREAHDGA